MSKNRSRKRTFLTCMIVLILALLFQGVSGFRSLEQNFSDQWYQAPGKLADDIYIIGIDEQTLSEYGPFDTWSRDKVADLINLLNSDPDFAPAVIAIDISFFGEKGTPADDKLADAVRNAGNVVLNSTATFGSVIHHDGDAFSVSTEAVLLEEPYEALKNAAAAIGFANTQADEDGVIRHAFGSIVYDGKPIRSFAQEIYSLYQGEDAPSFADDHNGFYIRYSGLPRDYFGPVGAETSLYRVLEGEIPYQEFGGSVVFIGAYTYGLQDNFYTSIDKNDQMYGVEVHANIFKQLMDQVYIREQSLWEALLVTLLIGLLVLLAAVFFDLKFSVPFSILIGIGYLFLIRWIYSGMNLILPVIYPVLTVFVMIVSQIIVRYVLAHQEKKRLIANYGRFLSPEIAAVVAEQGEESLALGGQKKDIAVLFVDIRSFTTLSEQLPPERVVEMLNGYLSVTTSSIFHQGGTVDKFIGDATMGVFNAPLDLEDYTYKAVCAGLEMCERAKTFAENLPDDLKGRVGFGVGIHCGDAVVGNIGTDFRMEYTAIGDTVNTASRLEGQAKAGWVVISEAVWNRIHDRIEWEDLGFVKLKGKESEQHLFRALKTLSTKESQS